MGFVSIVSLAKDIARCRIVNLNSQFSYDTGEPLRIVPNFPVAAVRLVGNVAETTQTECRRLRLPDVWNIMAELSFPPEVRNGLP